MESTRLATLAERDASNTYKGSWTSVNTVNPVLVGTSVDSTQATNLISIKSLVHRCKICQLPLGSRIPSNPLDP